MNEAFRDEATTQDSAPTWASNPPFDRRHLRVVELALRAAWDSLLKDPKQAHVLSNDNEVLISQYLSIALNKLRERKKSVVEGFNCKTFEHPRVGAETLTLDGKKVRKPDIVIALSGEPRPGVGEGMSDGVFIECKLLAQGKSNVAAYCRDGIQRFVIGAYAPRMREGMMLAYVRTNQSLPDALKKTLDDQEMRTLLATDGTLELCTLSRVEPRVYVSIHARNWPYPQEDGGGLPGPIEVRHLWLQV